MIVWSGFGVLTVVIAAVAVAIGGLLGSAGLAEGYALGIGLLLAAVGNWFAGSALNDPARSRELLDAKTGQRVIYRRSHSLFWIPMQWWSLVMVAGGLLLVGLQATGNYRLTHEPRRAAVISMTGRAA